MALAPDHLAYLELRAFTDCLLAYQVGDTLEFHGQDAVSVAAVCGYPLASRWRDARGNPVPMVSVPVGLPRRGPGLVAVAIDATNLIYPLNDAGYPVALAMEQKDDEGLICRTICFEWRPVGRRPALRLV